MTTHDPYDTVTVDVWVLQLSRTLSTPGLPANAVRNLRRADRTFNVLDHALRINSPLPLVWGEASSQGDAEAVTEVYDRLSSALRTVEGIAESFGALRVAVRAWYELDAALRSGGPLPEPWRR